MRLEPSHASSNPSAAPPPQSPRVMVLGANGFIGRHVVRALHAQGMAVVGVRRARPAAPSDADETGPTTWKHLQLHTVREPGAWREHLQGIDVVINCVGILRQRFGERLFAYQHYLQVLRGVEHVEQPVAPALQVLLPDWMSRTGAWPCGTIFGCPERRLSGRAGRPARAD